jgi:glycosyltransferase involved in cell wall biosynthesis
MGSDPPLVTVVTPTLNQAEFIEQTIRSVLSQDYPRIEYLVADGGSTDGTLDILGTIDSRVDWVSEADEGQADAIDRSFRRANGTYLAWLNSDDLYLPGAISAMTGFLESHPDHALVYGHADNIDASGRRTGPARQVERFDRNRLLNDVDFVAQPATMIRKDAYLAVGGLDTSFRWSFDYDLWLKLAARYPIGFLDRVLAEMRIHQDAKTATGGLPRLLEIERMARGHGRQEIPNGFAARMAWLRMVAAAAAVRQARFLAAWGHGVSGVRSLAAYLVYRARRLPRLSHFDSARERAG